MKTLYLMRHGETLFNVYHRVQGASDSPLTARGIAQAKEAKAFFKKTWHSLHRRSVLHPGARVRHLGADH